MRVIFRFVSQILIMAFLVAGCVEKSHAALFSDGFVVYVGVGRTRAISTPTTTSLKSTVSRAITNQQARREKVTRYSRPQR